MHCIAFQSFVCSSEIEVVPVRIAPQVKSGNALDIDSVHVTGIIKLVIAHVGPLACLSDVKPAGVCCRFFLQLKVTRDWQLTWQNSWNCAACHIRPLGGARHQKYLQGNAENRSFIMLALRKMHNVPVIVMKRTSGVPLGFWFGLMIVLSLLYKLKGQIVLLWKQGVLVRIDPTRHDWGSNIYEWAVRTTSLLWSTTMVWIILKKKEEKTL